MAVDPQSFGAAEARIASLEKSVDSLTEKVDELIALANRGRGAYWAGLSVAGIVGFLVDYLFRFIFR